MTRADSSLDRLAQALELEALPESWRAEWECFTSCGVCGSMQEVPNDLAGLLDLPGEAARVLEQAMETVRVCPDLTELAGLWHHLIYHPSENPTEHPSTWPLPRRAMGDLADMFPLVALVSGLSHTLEEHRRLAVPMEITRATLSDAGCWVRSYHGKMGVWGFGELVWLRRHVRGLVYQLGRLQFMPDVFKWPVAVFRKRGSGRLLAVDEGQTPPDAQRLAARGDKIMTVHIREGGKLDAEACDESFRQAREWLPKWFPESRFVAFTCYSWMMDPALREILPAESNLVRFQDRFYPLPVEGDETQTYQRVFGAHPIDLATAPRQTALQRAIVDHVSAGGRMRCTAGFIPW